MTLREKIADIISGGSLSREHRRRVGWEWLYRSAREDYESCCNESDKGWGRAAVAHNVLRAIIERGNTASPNSTVKAMVQLAKEGLGE